MKRLKLTIIAILPWLALGTQARADFFNGNFETGNLNGWTTFVTADGTNGEPGLPNVISFDTTGSGSSLAAHFDAGESNFNGPQAGGGILQNVLIGPGTFTMSVDIASQSPSNNASAGVFSMIVDGTTVATNDLGTINAGQTLRAHMSTNVNIAAAGSHEFRFLITRPFFSNPGSTPSEFLDNAFLSGGVAEVPEPSTWALSAVCLFGLAAYARKRKLNSQHAA